MTNEYRRSDADPACGTAICYEVCPGKKGEPYIFVDPADFMIVPGSGSFTKHLRRADKKRVRTVDMRHQDTDSDMHGAINWCGGNLDDEMFIVLGPNLSADQVLKLLHAVIKRVETRGIAAFRWSNGEYYPVGEKATKRR